MTLQVSRIVSFPDDHVGVDEEAFSLDGDVTDGVPPLRIVVGIWRNIQSDAFLVEGRADERHVAFPADQISHRFRSYFTTGV
jgi:hypothetical protein